MKATHCKNGHELTGEALYVSPKGRRSCRICRNYKTREWNRRYREEHGEAYPYQYHQENPQVTFRLPKGVHAMLEDQYPGESVHRVCRRIVMGAVEWIVKENERRMA